MYIHTYLSNQIICMRNLILLMLLLAFGLQNAWAQTKPISGTIVDSDGEPLVGVTVIIKGTDVGTVTNASGKYMISAKKGDTLVLRFIGMNTKEVEVRNRNRIDVTMSFSNTVLGEVVAIGYGTQKRVDVTGAVSSVNADVVEMRPVFSVEDALTGRISGVRVEAPDGTPGADTKLRIRGATSLTADSRPLYIIDGFPSETNIVNPGDVESIDVLKDAASTAIYGSRGANGVVIITTKKGKKNKINVNFSGTTGVQTVSKKLDLLDNYQFAKKNDLFGFFYVPQESFDLNNYDINAYTFFQDAESNYYLVSNKNQYRDPKYYKEDAISTNWQNEMFRTAKFNDYRININGGSEKTIFSVMAGYRNQEGVLLNTDHEEFNIRTNLEFDLNSRIKININNAVNRRNTSGYADASDGLYGVFYHTLLQAPVKPVEFDEKFVLEGESVAGQTINPVTMANTIENDKKAFDVLTNGALHIALPKGFGLHISGGYYYANIREDRYFPSNVAGGANVNGRSSRGNHVSERLNNENVLTYDKTFNTKHKLQLMGGASFEKGKYTWENSMNTDFTREGLGYYGHGYGKEPLIPTSTIIENTLASFYGRANYNYKDLWLLKFTMRADGSSKFAKNNKWGYFPSAAIGYRLSEEDFLKKVSFLDNLKLRLSWGITGKQAIPSYQSLASVGIVTTSIDGMNIAQGSYPARLDNPNLKWETTEEVNFGLDASLFSQRLNVSLDIYNRRTRDLLYTEPIPSYSGYRSMLRNVGILDNNGVELSIQGLIIDKALKWDANFNIARNKTKIVEFGEQPINYLNAGAIGQVHGVLVEGKDLGNWYGYRTKGIWQSKEEIDAARAAGIIASSEKVLPGYRRFVDLNNDGAITAEDRDIIGNSQPDFTGGLSNTFTYKNLQLSILLSYSVGAELYNYTGHSLSEGLNYDNQLDIARWMPTLYNWDPNTQTKGDLYMEGNQSNKYPIAMYGKPQDNTLIDSYVEDASFLRLSDITVTYNLPKKLLRSVGVENASVFVSGRNLAVWTNYSGFDPEVNNSKGEANYLLPGLDLFAYPKSKMISVGFKLNF